MLLDDLLVNPAFPVMVVLVTWCISSISGCLFLGVIRGWKLTFIYRLLLFGGPGYPWLLLCRCVKVLLRLLLLLKHWWMMLVVQWVLENSTFNNLRLLLLSWCSHQHAIVKSFFLSSFVWSMDGLRFSWRCSWSLINTKLISLVSMQDIWRFYCEFEWASNWRVLSLR